MRDSRGRFRLLRHPYLAVQQSEEKVNAKDDAGDEEAHRIRVEQGDVQSRPDSGERYRHRNDDDPVRPSKAIISAKTSVVVNG